MTEAVLRPLGAWALTEFRYGWALFRHLVRALVAFRRREGRAVVRRITLWQIYFTGVDAMPVVAGLALVLGAVIIAQALNLLTGTGNEDLLGLVMELVVIRELGPMMAAFIVIGRSGSSIAVELGNMRVGREVDLLESLGIDPFHLLVLPRMVGVATATFCLSMLFDLVAIVGGFCVAAIAIDTPFSVFFQIIATKLSFIDLVIAGVKPALFGLLIATISTYQGMAVGSAITDVPQATRRAVVHSLVLCILADAVLTLAFFAGGL